MCNINYQANEQEQGGGGVNGGLSAAIRNADAWSAWAGLTDLLLNRLEKEGKVKKEERRGIWGGNGARVYGIDWW